MHRFSAPWPAYVSALWSAIALTALGAPSAVASELFDHAEWADVLNRFVDAEGHVDYVGLAADPGALNRYLDQIELVGPESRPELFPDRDHELAYYINAYNALVFRGVLDRGPETESVWKGGLVSGYRFFVGMKVHLDGRRTNLRKLENDWIRKRYPDPRIHAALNCASLGCPRLPRQPFVGPSLQEQLDRAIREFVDDPRHVRADTAEGTVGLSKIFDWFDKDFLQFEAAQGNPDPRLVDYVNRYRPQGRQIPRDLTPRILDYDKGINAQTAQGAGPTP